MLQLKTTILGLLLATSLVACSVKFVDGGSNSAKDDDKRPSDETEGLPGYLTSIDLVQFKLQGRFLTVEAVPGAIQAPGEDVTRLYVNIMQISLRSLAETKVAAREIASAAPMEDRDWAEDEGVGGVGYDRPDADFDQSAPDYVDEKNNDADIGGAGDPGENDATNPDSGSGAASNDGSADSSGGGTSAGGNTDDGGTTDGMTLTQAAPDGFAMDDESPAELLMQGRLRASVNPRADGSFFASFDLESPEPIVVVVGAFDPIEMIAIQTTDDPRINTVVFSPAFGEAAVAEEFDIEYLESIDVEEVEEAVAQAAEAWPEPEMIEPMSPPPTDIGEDLVNPEPDPGFDQPTPIEDPIDATPEPDTSPPPEDGNDAGM